MQKQKNNIFNFFFSFCYFTFLQKASPCFNKTVVWTQIFRISRQKTSNKKFYLAPQLAKSEQLTLFPHQNIEWQSDGPNFPIALTYHLQRHLSAKFALILKFVWLKLTAFPIRKYGKVFFYFKLIFKFHKSVLTSQLEYVVFLVWKLLARLDILLLQKLQTFHALYELRKIEISFFLLYA